MTSTRKRLKSNYPFLLKGINADEIEKEYNITLTSNLQEEEKDPPPKTTQISDITIIGKETEYFSYLDEAKKTRKCIVTMLDYIKQQHLPQGARCYWCQHPFITQALGCPIRYVADQVAKVYSSEVSRDKYTVRENISKKRYEEINKRDSDSKTKLHRKDYYETDGIFCSFNCCMAFIKENKYKEIYKDSTILLNNLYYKIYGTSVKIVPAPSWKLLREYGGTMTIKSFRKTFNKLEYVDLGNIRRYIPEMRPIGYIMEEKIQF
uniref:A1L transcription factor/late transcription factor VLTF-2 n=1 Tax=Iridovirus LCIVAC01 TaxID=2506607 RepID=A0A481YQD4_9VIRU|nr:MAG: A1L transcription factor/late transcription factor VLTF-2 [Iridovirus LCIVAC01]